MIYYILCVTWAVVGFAIFICLFFVRAPYGRYSSQKWGRSVSPCLGWILMEIPAFFTFPLVVLYHWKKLDTPINIPILIFIFLWCFHYFNRTFIYPFRLQNKKKSMTLVTMFSGMLFNTISGLFLGYWFGVMNHYYPLSWLVSWQFIVGVVIFIIGMVINWHSDKLLIRLKQSCPDKNKYFIPYGGLFRWISCPNYFGEILEWTGFAIMTSVLPMTLFLWWVCANLIPRAISHHRDYRIKFSNYPIQRRAIVPYIL